MRPRAPLLSRLAKLLSMAEPDLQSTLDGWPTPSGLPHPCIIGPQLMHHDGRTQSTPRVVFELIYGEPLHKTWKLRRLCGIEGCCSPHHFQPELIFRKDGTPVVPLPPRTYALRVASIHDLPTDPEDVIDTVLMYEGGRDMSPKQLVERSRGLYTADEFALALVRIKAEGL